MMSLYRILSTFILAVVIGMTSITASYAVEPITGIEYTNPVSEISTGSSLGLILIVVGVTAGIILYANKKKLIE